MLCINFCFVVLEDTSIKMRCLYHVVFVKTNHLRPIRTQQCRHVIDSSVPYNYVTCYSCVPVGTDIDAWSDFSLLQQFHVKCLDIQDEM